MTDDFTKEHTKIAKGFAIIFMIILHLFAHDGWLYKNNCYTTIFNRRNIPRCYYIWFWQNMCSNVFIFKWIWIV